MTAPTHPQVSVVMSVYNDANYLREALDSILQQQGVTLEVIVVNDGSTDESGAILADCARQDSRVNVIDQPNAGLTVALIHGCRLARGQYIARQDSDDSSLPGRLAKQLAFLEANPRAAMVSCSTKFIGPAGEMLYVADGPEGLDSATNKLRALDPARIKGPNGHGSVMFRRSNYESVGGYRADFRYAQDLDLWMRLTDAHFMAFLPDVLYCVRVTCNSISMTQFAAQRELAKVIVACREARSSGGDESALLRRAAAICAAAQHRVEVNGFAGEYFIGKLLYHQRDSAAIDYLRRAVQAKPWNLRARIALARALYSSPDVVRAPVPKPKWIPSSTQPLAPASKSSGRGASPQISVVMSVYNDAANLAASLAGILQQVDADLELIVINDGSTDGSRAILTDFEKSDGRLRVIDQANAGLTAALIYGCRLARGEYIARHDADDESLPHRFAKQIAFLEANPQAGLVACATQYVGPAGELLWEAFGAKTPELATAELRAANSANIQAPNHGSVTFRRASYERVGGYRTEFRYAQDVDLWMRLTDQEQIGYLPEILYRRQVRSNSISMTRAATQRDLAEIIVLCREARLRGGDERPFLQRAAALSAAARTGTTTNQFAGDYFIGRALLNRRSPAALTYLRRAVQAKPWNLRARLALGRALLQVGGRADPIAETEKSMSEAIQ